ncbi:MAG: hypothetical protein JEZ08_11320 [Clostridiales bacterium]|nr:hypothetical protein [Clostridiales bacterium]
MLYTIDSSIPFRLLEAYVDELEDTDVKITLTKNPDRPNKLIRIPSTTVTFEGDSVEAAVHEFRMAFLSAGG